MILARPQGKKAIRAFPVTGLPPSLPPCSSPSFQGPPLPFTHFHPKFLGWSCKTNQTVISTKSTRYPKDKEQPTHPTPPCTGETREQLEIISTPGLAEARRNESFLCDLQKRGRHFQALLPSGTTEVSRCLRHSTRHFLIIQMKRCSK